jgi:hypothetical protein
LADYLPKLRLLVVPPRAVISPAVVDELQRRSIELRYMGDSDFSSEGNSAAPGSPQLVLEVVSRRFEPAELVRLLTREGIGVTLQQGDCLVTASQRLAKALYRSPACGAILTSHPVLAVCLANRYGVLRAAWANNLVEMAEHVTDIGANVLVLDFRKLTLWQLGQMLGRFVRLSPLKPPAVLGG